ncbi:unnamed protein product, partial [Mesorhabditis belari]|uniref:Uncharacterized protein n=1 Tax=Mesorhabditis belari TaxID=2138241 RepID=A0AAF3ER89_9BILA
MLLSGVTKSLTDLIEDSNGNGEDEYTEDDFFTSQANIQMIKSDESVASSNNQVVDMDIVQPHNMLMTFQDRVQQEIDQPIRHSCKFRMETGLECDSAVLESEWLKHCFIHMKEPVYRCIRTCSMKSHSKEAMQNHKTSEHKVFTKPAFNNEFKVIMEMQKVATEAFPELNDQKKKSNVPQNVVNQNARSIPSNGGEVPANHRMEMNHGPTQNVRPPVPVSKSSTSGIQPSNQPVENRDNRFNAQKPTAPSTSGQPQPHQHTEARWSNSVHYPSPGAIQPPIIPEPKTDWKCKKCYHYTEATLDSCWKHAKMHVKQKYDGCSKRSSPDLYRELDKQESQELQEDVVAQISIENRKTVALEEPQTVYEHVTPPLIDNLPSLNETKTISVSALPGVIMVCQMCMNEISLGEVGENSRSAFEHAATHANKNTVKMHLDTEYEGSDFDSSVINLLDAKGLDNQQCPKRAQTKKMSCGHVGSIKDCIEKSMVEAWLEKANACFPNRAEAFQSFVEKNYRRYLQEDEPGFLRDEEVEHGGVRDEEVAQDDLFTKVIKDEKVHGKRKRLNGAGRQLNSEEIDIESCSPASNANDDQALSSPASEQNNTKIAQEIDELQKLREELDTKNRGIAEKKKERKPLLMLDPNAISKEQKIDELKMLEAATTENLNIQEERRALEALEAPEAPEAHLAGAPKAHLAGAPEAHLVRAPEAHLAGAPEAHLARAPEAHLAGAPEAHLARALEARLAGAREAHLALQQELAKEAQASTRNLSFVMQELTDSDEMISLWKQLLEADPTAQNSTTILQQKEQELKDQALTLGYMMIALFKLRKKNTEPKK